MSTVEIILSALGGGTITQMLNFYFNNRKQSSDELTAAYNIIKEDNDRLRLDNNDYRSRLEQVEKELFVIRHLQASANHIPFPQWSKDKDGRMVWLNPSYELVFLAPHGKSAENYLGKTDVEKWGEEVGKIYQAGDTQVMLKKKAIKLIEPVLQPDGTTDDWEIIKFPTFADIQRDVLLGTTGIAIPTTQKQWDLILG